MEPSGITAKHDSSPFDPMPALKIPAHGANRQVRFPNAAAAAFGPLFLDPDACREWVIKTLHPAGAKCPACGALQEGNRMQRFWDGGRLQCAKCGKWFTAMTGTFLSGGHSDFRGIFLMALMMGLGIDNKTIAQKCKITPETVRMWRKKFNHA